MIQVRQELTFIISAIALGLPFFSRLMVLWIMTLYTSGSLGLVISCPPLNYFLSPWISCLPPPFPLKTLSEHIHQVQLYACDTNVESLHDQHLLYHVYQALNQMNVATM